MNQGLTQLPPSHAVDRWASRGVLSGWAWHPEAPGQEKFEASKEGLSVPLPTQRVPRSDVAAALGVQAMDLGFELTLPQDLCDALERGESGWWLRINGEVVGGGDLAALWQRRLVSFHDSQPLLGLDGLVGLHLLGWIAEPTPQSSVTLYCQGRELSAPLRRTEREDVCQMLGCVLAMPGFEFELPGSLWSMLAPDEDATLEVRVDGRLVGNPCTLKRRNLFSVLREGGRDSSPAGERRHRLLVLEHLVYAGLWSELTAKQQTMLRDLAVGFGLPEPMTWTSGPSHDVESESRFKEPPRPGLAKALRNPLIAKAALVLLALLRRFSGAGESFEVMLLQATRLFDSSLYWSQVPEGSRENLSAIRHYVRRGDAQSLVPNAFLNPRAYVAQLPGRKHPGVSRLLHYALVGSRRGLKPSSWFEPQHYLAAYRDVAASGREPLEHFLSDGWREGRQPTADFDASRESGQDLLQRLARRAVQASTDPALAYLLRGLPEGAALPMADRMPWTPAMDIEGRDYADPAWWEAMARRPEQPLVDVIIPVYAGVQETLCCIESVLTAPVSTPFELVVVDDCSPDPALSAALRALSQRGLITLLVNAENLGFVRTVNRALALHSERDVVILNADARVFNNWLDRMLAHWQGRDDVATITPLSNNATICSFPETLVDNGPMTGEEAAALDHLASRINAGVAVDAPTGVGFCMAMRRSVLNEIGLLDAVRFGRGYGEENDWCQRALQHGRRNLLVADVFALHQGAVSFASESSERILAAMAVLAETFPGYAADVSRFVSLDPLRSARIRLEAARWRAKAGGVAGALLISHARGGGTERHEAEQAEALAKRGLVDFRLRPSRLTGRVDVFGPGLAPIAGLRGLQLSEELVQVLRELRIKEVQLHQLVDFSLDLKTALPGLCEAAGASLTVVVHDYHLICPRINLVGERMRYCGEPAAPACDACLASDGLLTVSGPISTWRQQSDALLRSADAVVAPDDDVALRLQRHFRDLPVRVVPHEPDLSPSPVRVGQQAIRHVLVVGAISRIKGYDVLLALAGTQAARSGRLSLTLLGTSHNDAVLRAAGVDVLGRYEDADLPARLSELAPDLAFIPSVWPETYCYVLSALLKAGCLTAVFDLGAPARRLHSASVPAVWLPLQLADDPELLAERLLSAEPQS
ncbi:glycosyltransferase family 2 protein [Ideonella sp.]|uniref:glycosyltransferase family 2 protein n=1 Tax=Ideonella sp. TaxID=1929293 RepID=UPI003BB69485